MATRRRFARAALLLALFALLALPQGAGASDATLRLTLDAWSRGSGQAGGLRARVTRTHPREG